MFSFDHATGVMYTCDAFGAHYATEAPFDTELQALTPHFRFYYDCLMRPNARSVLTALRKVKDLDYTTVATGHGPIIRYNLDELIGRQASFLVPHGDLKHWIYCDDALKPADCAIFC